MSASPITFRPFGTTAGPSPAQRPAVAAQRPAPASADRIETRSAPTQTRLHNAAIEIGSSTTTPADTSRRAALVQALLAHVPAADRTAAKTAIPAILDAARRTGSTDPNRIGYLLATAQTESDFGANMTEVGHSKEWFNAAYGCADGNRPGTSDGYAYRGRGYVQTTGAGRYAEISRHLGLPDVVATSNGHTTMQPALVAHPEQLTQPELAARALVVGIQKNLYTHNPAAALDVTIPTGKRPGDVDFYHARGIVNGIVKAQAQAIATHATTYAQILDSYRHSVLGVSAER